MKVKEIKYVEEVKFIEEEKDIEERRVDSFGELMMLVDLSALPTCHIRGQS